MKSLINQKYFICVAILIFGLLHSTLFAAFLDSKDILVVNSISRFFETPPQGIGLKYLSSALKSENPVVKGIAAAIYYKHFGEKGEKTFFRSISLSIKKPEIDIGKRKIYKFKDMGRILEMTNEVTQRIKHDTAREIAEFFFFRKNNAWMIGSAGEKLSLASFSRIKFLRSLLGKEIDPIKFSREIDLKTK